MKCRSVVLVSLLALSPVVFAHENASASKAAVSAQPMQPASESGAEKAVSNMPKPSEAEAIEAAVAYLTRDGRLTVEETEFLAWGTYSEQYVYWPMKLRMRYKREGGEKLRTNDYALKVFKAANGDWQAAQYYAWRADFK
jgi:hypothetical protein